MTPPITPDERAAMRERYTANLPSAWDTSVAAHGRALRDLGTSARDDVPRLLDALDTAEAEVARLRTMVGDCHCDKNPDTTNGPEEDCPQHGRPVAEVWGIVKRVEAEVERLRAEVASLRQGAQVLRGWITEHEETIVETSDALDEARRARPAPAWDEEAVRESALKRAYRVQRTPIHEDDAWAFGEGARAGIESALAVVREHLPVKPSREDVARILNPVAWKAYDAMMATYPDEPTNPVIVEDSLTKADAVLDLFPGRSEAEVKAEAWDEGYADYLEGPAEMTNPYRAERGDDRG